MTNRIEYDIANKKVKQRIENEVVEFNYSDFEDLKNNSFYKQAFAGYLKVTSGKIVCADPLAVIYPFPQDWQIPIGSYPVYIYEGSEEEFEQRIAYAELIVREEIPKFWVLS